MNRPLREQLGQKHSAVVSLCQKYGVASLDLFGSGTTVDWNPDTSDLDFVVVFRPDGNRSLADRYVGLADDLEALFHRRVDLLTPGAIRNPFLRDAIEATRARVYGE